MIDTTRMRTILKKQGITDKEIDEIIDGTRKGIEAWVRGDARPWDEVKKELNLQEV